MRSNWKLLKLVQFASIVISATCVKIRIIDGPFSLQNAGIQTQNIAPVDVKIVLKVQPQPLSGPPHLFPLSGKCFELQKTNYKYQFCPFHNVTQREQTYRWNAFHGVLGVWKEWSIVNNTFEYMLMTDGETCIGHLSREVKVQFICGNDEKFMNIEEPSTCKYNVTFRTPLACADDAFMVYPVLSDDGKDEWDYIEDGYSAQEITPLGYNKKRRQLFIKEGFLTDKAMKPAETATDSQNHDSGHNGEDFARFSKEECIQNYEKLLAEVKHLRLLLNSTNRNQDDNKSEKNTKEDGERTPHSHTIGSHSGARKSSNNTRMRVDAKLGEDNNRVKLGDEKSDEKQTERHQKSTHDNNSRRKKPKKRKGRMGDDGDISEEKNSAYQERKGHWLGSFLKMAKRAVNKKKTDTNEASRPKDRSHVHHR